MPVEYFITKQPIFYRDKKKVYGYELLFHNGLEEFYKNDELDLSTVDAILQKQWKRY